ncbi:4'-phosphopantetheinyl transferase superfamily protein [Streptomyces sp. NPDC048290]|uniref:4'-phosphopantetheinyl transferase family protein n=1 Tax=Streptomyces sp. NPDC048290 TaxID=3155811 RepID=UPI00341CE01F
MTADLTVATAAVGRVLALRGAGEAVLTAAERRRAAAARTPAARGAFVAARCLVRLCVARRTGTAPWDVVLEQRCSRCGGPHGPPRVRGATGRLSVSLSYADGFVAAAAADRPVGIDIERLPAGTAGPDPWSRRRFLTTGELARIRGSPEPRTVFLRTWVRKEALVKLGTDGLPAMPALDLSALPLTPAGPDRPHRIGRRCLYDLADAPTGVVGAVAVIGPGDPASPTPPVLMIDSPIENPAPEGEGP